MSTINTAIIASAAVLIVLIISLAYIRVREGSDRSDERTAHTQADAARERRTEAATERDRRAAEAE